MSVHQASELEALKRTLTNPSEEPIMLSYPVIETLTQNFSVEIGRGGFGVVYLGSLPGGRIAVKKLSGSQDLDDKLFTDEVNCLIRAKHENIVRFLGYCAHTQGQMIKFEGRFVLTEVRQRILCFEFVPNGNLHNYLQEKPTRDEWYLRYQMVRGICLGLKFLHEELINHLDLKPENVMLDTQMKPKITDFGLSRFFDEGQSRVFTQNIRGTPGYIAPEAIDNGEISFKSDIFSLGIIMIKLLTGRNKYDLENWTDLLDVDGPEANVCVKIAQACLQVDQHKRPTIGEIIHELNEFPYVIKKTTNDTSSYGHPLVAACTDIGKPVLALPGDILILPTAHPFRQTPATPLKLYGSSRQTRRNGDTIILYVTTLGSIGKTFYECNTIRSALQSHHVNFIEKDLFDTADHLSELKRLLVGTSYRLPVPVLSINGIPVGDARKLLELHGQGRLQALFENNTGPSSHTPRVRDDIILYVTTLGSIGKTLYECNTIRSALQSHHVDFIEKDMFKRPDYLTGLKRLLRGSSYKLILPVLSINGIPVGDAHKLLELHSEGRLHALFE